MNSLAICLLILSALPKSPDTVEGVRTKYVEIFKQEPAGKVMIVYLGGSGCLGGPRCPDNDVTSLGLMQAATDTGHPILFRTHGSYEDEPKYVLQK